MNILYLSKLTGNLFAGPNYSVPAQIKAQALQDNVFWYNLNTTNKPEWREIGCHSLEEYPVGRLSNLPAPFDHPDLVVIEEFYCYPFAKIIYDVQKERIPYIIVPRSELTQQAQKKKFIKKRVGNLLYFNNFARKACAIQYLSEQEKWDSEKRWKKKSFIIPNGIDKKKKQKQYFSQNKIKAVYIGRYEKYQKGLDLLIESINCIKEILREKNFVLNMYGVDQEGTFLELIRYIKTKKLEDLIHMNDGVFGADKEQILLDADIFVMTSRFEGLPMGLIEALSYGIPVVATKGTNLSKAITKFNAGWVALNTVESICEAFLMMLEDRELFDKKSHNAINLSELYSWESIASQSHAIYMGLQEEMNSEL